ncbi:helix-turn-helix transcriptional regulator [Larkinella terrae]|uniref:Helix-turn-helix domain-containing protein n=1 Tax=Larkinella terrae TaxID=2025311 RepID=A0A7K0EF14_9BACT|nr:AraC family transcriptional regulator [Larkinella terrae]MRS60292.1 helix-turn-helix domain-containing protein [Larkinella terrae]
MDVIVANTPPEQSASLWDYSLSFIADMASVVEHYHHCYKVVISLDNDFECLIDGQALFGLRGFIVNQTIPHSCYAPNANVLVNFIETGSFWGWQLRALLGDKTYLTIDSVLAPEQYLQVFPANYAELSNEKLVPHVNAFLNSLLPLTHQMSEFALDSRIQATLRYIDQNLHMHLELEDIANQLCLSPDRARHLFVQQMGIPFSQYILWKRIRNTMAVAITEESKLADACLRFGFTDQPHFNRTFKRIFGLPPVGIIRHCRVLL